MKDTYCLRIETERLGQVRLLDLLLEREHNTEADCWEFEIEENEMYRDFPTFYLTELVGIVKDKFEDLRKIGIRRDMISIWRCVGYEREGYMEYAPEDLKLLGENGIKFRISCYPEEPDFSVGSQLLN